MNQKNLKNSQQIGDYDLSGFLAELNSINHLAILIAQLGQAAYYLAREEHTSEADTVSGKRLCDVWLMRKVVSATYCKTSVIRRSFFNSAMRGKAEQ